MINPGHGKGPLTWYPPRVSGPFPFCRDDRIRTCDPLTPRHAAAVCDHLGPSLSWTARPAMIVWGRAGLYPLLSTCAVIAVDRASPNLAAAWTRTTAIRYYVPDVRKATLSEQLQCRHRLKSGSGR